LPKALTFSNYLNDNISDCDLDDQDVRRSRNEHRLR